MVDLVQKDMLTLWADTGDILAPDDTKISNGWDVELVPRQWWNWMQNRVDTNVAYLLQKGIPEWNPAVEYIISKSYIQHLGVVYKCIQTHTNETPVVGAYWTKAFNAWSQVGEAVGGVTPAANTYIYFTSPTAATTATITPYARTLLDDADATSARTTLDAQQADATLTALAGVATGTNKLPYFTGTDAAAVTDLTAFARTLLDDSTSSAARTTLDVPSNADLMAGLATKQPLDATLTAVAGVTTAADTLTYFTGVDTAASTPLTAFARTLLDDATVGAARTTLDVPSNADLMAGLATKQPLDDTLTALAGLATGVNQLAYSTGTDTFAQTPLTAFARTLLDDNDGTAARTTLGLANSAIIAASAASTPSTLVLRGSDGSISGGQANLTGAVITGSMELGATTGSTGPTFIDFHTGGATVVDYDTRIISDTPSGAIGGGKLTYIASGGHVFTGPVVASVTGNATTATTLQTARTIALSGEVTGTATSFDGSGNISISTAVTDSGWLTPSYINEWSAGATNSLQYKKVGNIVYLNGRIGKTAPVPAIQNMISAIPAAYRPTKDHSQVVIWINGSTLSSYILEVTMGTSGILSTGLVYGFVGTQSGAGEININLSWPV